MRFQDPPPSSTPTKCEQIKTSYLGSYFFLITYMSLFCVIEACVFCKTSDDQYCSLAEADAIYFAPSLVGSSLSITFILMYFFCNILEIFFLVSNSYLLQTFFPKWVVSVKYMPLPIVVIFQCLTLNLLWQPLCMSPSRPDSLLNSSYQETNTVSGHFFSTKFLPNACLHCLQLVALLQVYIQFMNHMF